MFSDENRSQPASAMGPVPAEGAMKCLALLLMAELCLCAPDFDLYLTESEVSRLLGVGSRLYYVLGGAARPAAMAQPVQMDRDNDRAHLTWSSSSDDGPDYSLRVLTSDATVLRQPSLNISHRGRIGKREQTWRVSMPCNFEAGDDDVEAEAVEVTIEIKVRDVEEEVAYNISRTKLCPLRGAADLKEAGSTADLSKDDGEDSSSQIEAHVVFAGVTAALACFTIAIITAIIVVNWRHGRRAGEDVADGRKSTPTPQQQQQQQQYYPEHQQYQQQQYQPMMQQYPYDRQIYHPQMHHPDHIRPGPSSSSPIPPPPPPANPPPTFLPSLRQHRDFQMVPMTSDPESRVTDWVQSQHRQQQHPHHHRQDLERPQPEAILEMLSVDRLSLKLGQLLQEGTFGRVYQGTLLGDDGVERDVVIKTVVAGASQGQRNMLVAEGTALYGMEHNHIQTLLASTFDGTSPMLVYPYAPGGNLKKWLQQGPTQSSAGASAASRSGLSTHAVVGMGVQLLKALQHLHKRRIVHKDVAARNCILGDRSQIRLCDSALSRDLFPTDYHCLGDNENRPVKWMPMEAIGRKKYSRASDVWSFGVFLWELMTRAQQPFSDVDPFEMEAYLRSDFRLHQPNNCPDQLYSVLVSCWAARPADRATVHSLYSQLQQLQKQLQQFV